MSEVISMKDFFNHDTRILLLESTVVNIDRRFDQIEKQFEQVEKRFDLVEKKFDKLESKMDSQFKWIISCLGALSLTTITTLIAVITALGRHA